MVEGSCGQYLERSLKNPASHGGVATLRRDQLGGIVGRELVDEEEVGGGGGLAEKLDAFANEWGDGE